MNNNDVSISIFSYRESTSVLLKSILHCIDAAKKYTGLVHVNVLINGNESLFDEIKEKINILSLSTKGTAKLSIYSFKFGDKANIWNQYFYLLKPSAKFHVFIDGYVYIENDTFTKLSNEYEKSPYIAATGVPSVGRTADKLKKQMITQGGMHGNLCILTDDAIEEIVKRSFRIPVNLYRVDGLVGGIINFNFCPKENQWNSFKVKVLANLTWTLDEKNNISLRDVISQLKRTKRQLIGSFENKAIREYLAVERIEIGQLPRYAPLLLLDYVIKHPLSFMQKITSPMVTSVYKDILKNGENFNPPEKLLLEKHRVKKF